MNRISVIIAYLSCMFFFTGMIKADEYITLATTTSTVNSGLLDYLHPDFIKTYNVEIRVIPRGTGAALQLARDGNADVVMVHSREAEKQFIKEGYGTQRYPLMYNDFVLLGPESDPAGVKSVDILTAFGKIKSAKSRFISRGDNSGTHNKENKLWETAGIQPGWSSYLSVGQGMGKTLTIADEKQAYTLSDRGTYIAMRRKLTLGIMSEGSALLANPYSVIPVNPQKHPHVKFDLVKKYINWLLSEETQKTIAEYSVDGEQLFHPGELDEKGLSRQ